MAITTGIDPDGRALFRQAIEFGDKIEVAPVGAEEYLARQRLQDREGALEISANARVSCGLSMARDEQQPRIERPSTD